MVGDKLGADEEITEGLTGSGGVPAVAKIAEFNPVYKVLRDFKVSLNSSLAIYKMGELISDPSVIRLLLEGKSPIAPVSEQCRYVFCPACNHQFPIEE